VTEDRYPFLAHHAMILLSHPGWNNSILNPVALVPMLSYPTELLFMKTTPTAQLNKLPLITIIVIYLYLYLRYNTL